VKEFRNPPTGPEEREKLGQRRISQRVAHGSHLLADGLQKGMISHLCKTAGVRIAPEYRELIRERIKTGRTCNGEWRQVWPQAQAERLSAAGGHQARPLPAKRLGPSQRAMACISA
jgi:hypothetical protein